MSQEFSHQPPADARFTGAEPPRRTSLTKLWIALAGVGVAIVFFGAGFASAAGVIIGSHVLHRVADHSTSERGFGGPGSGVPGFGVPGFGGQQFGGQQFGGEQGRQGSDQQGGGDQGFGESGRSDSAPAGPRS